MQVLIKIQNTYLFGVVDPIFSGTVVNPLLGGATISDCTTGVTIAALAFSLARSYSFFNSSTRLSRSSVIT